MAKSLYSALFDWIVFRTNHALLNNKDLEDNSKVSMKTRKHIMCCRDTHALLVRTSVMPLLFIEGS